MSVIAEFAKKLKPEQFKQPYRDIAEKIGIEATVKLAEYFGGRKIYLPILYRAVKDSLLEVILLDYIESNYKELSKKRGFSKKL